MRPKDSSSPGIPQIGKKNKVFVVQLLFYQFLLTINRTSSRTSYYLDAKMSAKLMPRFPETLVKALQDTAPNTEIHGIHDNWKIARYESGESFPAHYDQGT